MYSILLIEGNETKRKNESQTLVAFRYLRKRTKGQKDTKASNDYDDEFH